jgi:hypothetical protein
VSLDAPLAEQYVAHWIAILPRMSIPVFTHKRPGSESGVQSSNCMRIKYALTKSEKRLVTTAKNTTKPVLDA